MIFYFNIENTRQDQGHIKKTSGGQGWVFKGCRSKAKTQQGFRSWIGQKHAAKIGLSQTVNETRVLNHGQYATHQFKDPKLATSAFLHHLTLMKQMM